MENKKKCSLKEHKEITANTYCIKCDIYMCNKCELFHSKLFQDHNLINIDKKNNDFFIGFCKEEKHKLELEFFCKTHNILCCAACIAKIRKNEFGKHKDFNICDIEDIKEEKEKKFMENFKLIQSFSEKNKNLIKNLNEILEKINEKKEELKLKIQQIFTKIRNELNKKEDELLANVDKLYEKIYILKKN